MVAAAYTAANLELIDEAARRRIVGLIHQAGLPTGGMTLDPETVYQAMFFDKKVKAGKLRLVLPQGIGKATIRDDVPAELIRAAIRSLV
jgi:3-dehydroquinate synthase